jgi:beta-hydroxylase
MIAYLPNLLAPKFSSYAFTSGMYIHYRGRIRHRFYRQPTDHSTFMAPYNVDVHVLGRSEPAMSTSSFSRVEAAGRQLANAARGSPAAV